MTIYYCHACKYTFPAISPDRCPDCGAYAVHPATEEQIKDYERIRKEIEAEIAEETNNTITASRA